MTTFLTSFPIHSIVSMQVRQGCRFYTKGAEKLFHRVDWERAVGMVVVVDPFDPSSMLYLPQAMYTDLIKTALANRSPLVVVHGLADVVPDVTDETDPKDHGKRLRTYRVNGVLVHSIPRPPSSQNSPLPGIDPSHEGSMAQKPSRRDDSGTTGGSSEGGPGRRTAYGGALLRTLWGLSRDRRRRDTSGLRQKLRDWTQFLPKDFGLGQIKERFPALKHTHRRRPYCASGNVEATLLHRYVWIGATFLARSARSLQWSFAILSHFVKIWQNNGLKVSVNAYAEARRRLMKYIAGEPDLTPCNPGISMGIDKVGLPTLLPRALRRYIIAGHVTAIRLAFFMLNLSDAFHYEAPPKLDNITLPYSGSQVKNSEFEQEVIDSVKQLLDLSGSRPPIPIWNGFHMSVKAGPFAKALISAPFDAVALKCSRVWDSFQMMCTLTQNTKNLVKNTDLLAQVTLWLMKPYWSRLIGKLTTGKLSHVLAPRGKMRTVAIPGYQVQSIMRPLHDSLFKFLGTLETDHTFHQEKGVRRAMDSGNINMDSYDLSAATDRFPIWVQVLVLRALYNGNEQFDSTKYSYAWGEILEGLEFIHRPTPKGRASIYSYGAGQPMGCYSSWAAFTVSHHVMVQLAALRAGWDGIYRDYELLGDDIVIRGDTEQHTLVKESYRDLMKSLGVGINPIKGVHSTNGTFEFAKRFVRKNEVLSSLRFSELFAITSWKGVYGLFLSTERRGLPLPHLRVALELGTVLVTGVPLNRDLTRIRQVALHGIRSLREAVVLLTSPTGPYKVPLVAWLSGHGAYHVDFHPNLGHFVNSINRIVIEYELQYPISISIQEVRKNIAARTLAATSSMHAFAKALTKICPNTGRLVDMDESGAIWNDSSLNGVALTDHAQAISDELRGVRYDQSSFSTMSGFVNFVGATAKADCNPDGTHRAYQQRVLSFCTRLLRKGKHVFPVMETIMPDSSFGSKDLFVGLLRTVIANSPARLVNIRLISELLGTSLKGACAFDPDRNCDFGSTGRDEGLESLVTRVGRLSEAIIPKDYAHPAQLLQKFRACITDYMKVQVADMLPSSLPAHLDYFKVLAEANASAALKAYKALRKQFAHDPESVFTLPEITDRTGAPAYMLEFTHCIRLDTSDPAACPRPESPVLETFGRLANPEGFPCWYVPDAPYAGSYPGYIKFLRGERALHSYAIGHPNDMLHNPFDFAASPFEYKLQLAKIRQDVSLGKKITEKDIPKYSLGITYHLETA